MNCIILFGLIAGCVVTNGIPLESPKEDHSKFFSTRIVGGEDAPDNFAPHQAALAAGRGEFASLVCGGSIVSETHILTAAHCIDPFVEREGKLMELFHARVGTNLWYTGGYAVQFKRYHNHPQWDPFTISYDVGVLELTKPLTRGARVAVLPLGARWVGAGEPAFVTGWGRTETWGEVPRKLQVLRVRTIGTKACATDVVAAGHGWWTPPVLPHVEICTFHSKGHGMCNGDSGSALVSQKDGTQIGIVSWGFPCAVGAPDVFARISGLIDFIQKVLKNKKIQ